MPRSRRTLGLDRELVEKIKEIAKRRGMTLSEYLRALLQGAISLEEEGAFAPKILENAKYDLFISSLRFVLLPLDIFIERKYSSEEIETARQHGERIGKVLSEMLIDARPLIERIGGSVGLVLRRGSDLIIVKTNENDYRRFFSELMIGIARGNGYKISETEQLVVIKQE